MKQLSTVALVILTTATQAQPENWALVRQKTMSRLESIVNGVDGAAGFVAMDLTSGETFAVNENLTFPQGSAIKIPILMEVYKQAGKQRLSLSDLHAVTSRHQVGGSGILQSLGDSTSFLSVRDLCVLMILMSDNTATNILIDLVGMDNVNGTMNQLGLEHTTVRRRMIDSEASRRGDENLSTPAEAAEIMRILYRGEFVDQETSAAIVDILRLPKRGAFNSGIPDEVPVAFKPGGIPGVSTEWAIVYHPRRPYVIVGMENYTVGNEASDMMKQASRVCYDYFSRLGRASKYGTYVD